MNLKLPLHVLVTALVAACGGGSGADGVDGATGADGHGSGSGSGSGADDRLDPLEVGRSWTYSVTSTYGSCPSGMHDTRVIAAGTTDGGPTYQVQSFCGLTGNTNVAGDRVEEYFDWGPTGWMRSLDEPVRRATRGPRRTAARRSR